MTRWLPRIALIGTLLMPALCFAENGEDGGPSILSYGFKGFFTGAGIGLAAGYLSTGSTYESHEWRNLVMGAGIGAIAGVGAGVGLALADVGQPGRGTGWYVLRDTDLGTFLGAFTGAAVGALVWVDDGRAKDVLIGASIGALIGAGVGIAFGIVEGLTVTRHASEHAYRSEPGIHLMLSAAPGLGRGAPPTWLSGVQGRF